MRSINLNKGLCVDIHTHVSVYSMYVLMCICMYILCILNSYMYVHVCIYTYGHMEFCKEGSNSCCGGLGTGPKRGQGHCVSHALVSLGTSSGGMDMITACTYYIYIYRYLRIYNMCIYTYTYTYTYM